MPRQSFNHTATTPARGSRVWESLQEPQTWEAIPGVDRVIEPLVDGSGALRGFSFESVAGGRKYIGKATEASRVEGESMSFDITTLELTGLIGVRLLAQGTATEVDVTLEVESRGILSSMFFPVIASVLGNGFPNAVDRFADGLDSPRG